MQSTPQLSSYFEGLNEEAKARYKEKISLINGNNPFGKVVGGETFNGVVPVDACDLVSYLVLQTSFITSEQFKARKGLEAYNQFVCGWIKDVSTIKILGKYLSSLKEPSYLQLNYLELLAKCESVSVDISKEMAEKVEQATRSQSHSKLWFKYRAGRITASRMKAVCRTDPGNPAQSLIKSICYPEAFSFTTVATKWGCKHEKQGQEMYLAVNKLKHHDLSVAESGLVINPQWPFIGASPDGIINCTCCGKGVLEIKCPYCHQGTDVQAVAIKDSRFCLKMVDGELQLDHTHTYYYQVQSQLFVCDVEYGDFCVCTFSMDEDESHYLETGMHIERIYKDPNLWIECTTKSSQFFKTCLLPEIMGNWYTRPSFTAETSNADLSEDSTATGSSLDHDDTPESADTYYVDQPSYCYCRGPEEGTMIACDNPDCPIEWFHTKCLRLHTLPKGKTKWYCPDCRKLSKFLRGKGKK